MANPFIPTPARRRIKLKAKPQQNVNREAALKRIYVENKHTYDDLSK